MNQNQIKDANEEFEQYNQEQMQKQHKQIQKREDGNQMEDFPRQVNLTKNPQRLNDENADFLDNSLSVLEVSQIDVDKKDMKNRNQLGFQRKFLQSSVKKEKKTKDKDQQYETLDVKATLANSNKGLSNYSTKTEVQFKLDQGMPIPFIVFNKDSNQWQFSDQASEAIQQVRGPVSFVSIIGQPQSGKSTLMNLLIQDDEQFKYKFVSQTEETMKGLIIWSDPTFNTQTGTWIFFVGILFQNQFEQDSQDTDAGQEVLKQQFIISCLISSVLIVNNQGKLQNESFQLCQNLLYINDLIEMDYSLETNEELKVFNVKEELSVLFPHMLFVLRDFQDNFKENGRNITWNQYLEHFLTDNQSFSIASPENKKVISRILKYFRLRDAHSLVFPLKNKNSYDVMMTPFKDLDETFQEEIKILRKKIIQYQQKKEFRGIFFSSNMSVSFISSIIEDINQKKKINIQKAFEILIENEFIYVFNESIDIYNNFLSDKFQDEQFKNFEVLLQILREAREQAENTFYVLKAHDTIFTQKYFEEYMDKLTLMMNEKEQKIIQFNGEEQIRQINLYTTEKMKEIQKLTENQSFKIQDIYTILNSYEVMLDTVIRQCMGEGKEKQPIGAISSKILKDMTNLIIQEIQEMKNKLSNKSQTLQKELENQIKQKEQQQANKIKEEEQKQEVIKKELEQKEQERKEIDQKLKVQQQKAKQLEDETQKLEAELKKTQQELEIQKKKGCCEIY